MNQNEQTILTIMLPRGRRVYSVPTISATWGSTAHFYVVREDDLRCIDNLLVNALGEPYRLYRRDGELYGVQMIGDFKTVRTDLIKQISQLLYGDPDQLVHCNLMWPIENQERNQIND